MVASKDVTPEMFEAAAAVIRDPAVPEVKPSTQADKLRLYGLYKLVKDGPMDSKTSSSRPSMFYWEARAKHDAYATASKEFAQNDSIPSARVAYVQLAEQLVGPKAISTAMSK